MSSVPCYCDTATALVKLLKLDGTSPICLKTWLSQDKTGFLLGFAHFWREEPTGAEMCLDPLAASARLFWIGVKYQRGALGFYNFMSSPSPQPSQLLSRKILSHYIRFSMVHWETTKGTFSPRLWHWQGEKKEYLRPVEKYLEKF